MHQSPKNEKRQNKFDISSGFFFNFTTKHSFNCNTLVLIVGKGHRQVICFNVLCHKCNEVEVISITIIIGYHQRSTIREFKLTGAANCL